MRSAYSTCAFQYLGAKDCHLKNTVQVPTVTFNDTLEKRPTKTIFSHSNVVKSGFDHSSLHARMPQFQDEDKLSCDSNSECIHSLCTLYPGRFALQETSKTPEGRSATFGVQGSGVVLCFSYFLLFLLLYSGAQHLIVLAQVLHEFL